MVFVKLNIRLITEKIIEFGINDIESYCWKFNIVCTHCKTPGEKPIDFFSNEKIDTIKSTCNFSKKCKTCKREMRITILQDKIESIGCEEGENKGNLAEFELKGCNLEKWIPMIDNGFYVICEDSENKMIVDEFLEGEAWCDVDEETGNTLVLEIEESEFLKA